MQESDEGAKVDLANKAYSALLEAKLGNDSFISASAQTLDNMTVLRKHHEMQTDAPQTTESAAQWDVSSAEQVAVETADQAQADQGLVAAHFAFPANSGAYKVCKH